MEALRARKGANGNKRRCRKLHWTREEDEILTTLVNRHGIGRWDFIANHIQGRTGKSCRVRWINQLDPKIDKTPFSEGERERLFELHRVFGNKWSTIVKFFPKRTDNQVKNQYHVLAGSHQMKAYGSSSSTDSYTSTVPVGSEYPIAEYSTDSSSVYGRDESSDHQKTSLGDTMIDANSTATSKLCSVAQPQEKGVKNYEFFDFLGVGTSD